MTDASKALSPKVVAGTAGAGAGAITTTLVTWVVGAAYSGDLDGRGRGRPRAWRPRWPASRRRWWRSSACGLVVGVAFTFIPAYFITDHLRIQGEVESVMKSVDAHVEPAGPAVIQDQYGAETAVEEVSFSYAGERGK